jgi:hypothetical protein
MAAPSFSEILERIRSGIVPGLGEFRRDVSREVAAFFADALHVSPERRPRSAAEFGRRLEKL